MTNTHTDNGNSGGHAAPPLGKLPAYQYRERHGVIIECDNAAQQQRFYEALQALGVARLRLVSV